MRDFKVPIIVLASAAIIATGTPLFAQSEASERTGIESVTPGAAPQPNPALREVALGMLPDTGLLLIPESSNDRVMAFDPMTGDLIDPDFIPADMTNLMTPIHAILSASGDTVLLSDQVSDAVFEYDLDTGAFIGLFAPAGGVDNNILDNIRGISLDPAGNLLVSVGGGANDDAIAAFDTAGNFIGNRVANGAAGLNSPFDVFIANTAGPSVAPGDLLVGGITSDTLHRYLGDGTPQPDIAPVDTFPEQVYQIPGGANAGNLLVGNFLGTQEGVIEFDSAGMVVGIYDPPSLGGYRGAYELGNGNILTTNGGGVHEIDRAGNLVETKIAGVSARFIEPVFPGMDGPGELPIPTLSFWGMMGMTLLLAFSALWLVRRRTV